MADLEPFAEDGSSVFDEDRDSQADYQEDAFDDDLSESEADAYSIPKQELPVEDDFPPLGANGDGHAHQDKPVEVAAEEKALKQHQPVEDAPQQKEEAVAEPEMNGFNHHQEEQQLEAKAQPEPEKVAEPEAEVEPVQQQPEPEQVVEEEVQPEPEPVQQVEVVPEIEAQPEPVQAEVVEQQPEPVAEPEPEPVQQQVEEAVAEPEPVKAEAEPEQQQIQPAQAEAEPAQQEQELEDEDDDDLPPAVEIVPSDDEEDEVADGQIVEAEPEEAFEDVSLDELDDGIVVQELEADPIPEGPIAFTELDRKYRRARMFQSLQSNGLGRMFFANQMVDAPKEAPSTEEEESEDAAPAETEKSAAVVDPDADPEAPPKLDRDNSATDKADKQSADSTELPAQIPIMRSFQLQAVSLLTEAANEGHFLSQIRLWQHKFRELQGKLAVMDLDYLERTCSQDPESFRATSAIPFRPTYLQTVHMALGRAYSIHSTKKDFYLAAHHFREAAKLGEAMALQRLGYAEYRLFSDLMPSDPKQAIRYLKLAAKHKFAEAHHHLMNLYIKGHPPIIERSQEKALVYAESGAALGNGACLFVVGEAHDKAGRKAEAAQCFLDAAKAGVHAAVRFLQFMMMNGNPHGARAFMEYQQWSQQQQQAMEQQLRMQRAIAAMRERQEAQTGGGAGASSAQKGVACARCERPGSTLRCSQCRSVKYCSEDCQQRHWKAHKTQCKKLTKA